MPLPAPRWAAGLAAALLLGACAGTPYLADFERQRRRLWPGAAAPDPGPAPELAAPLELAACLDLARRRNPGLRAAFARWREALAGAHAEGWLPEPRLTWAHFLESIETRTGPQRNRLTLIQPLPWFGRLGLEREKAELGARVLLAEVDRVRLDLERRVVNAWTEYRYLGRAVAINREMLELLEGLEPVVQRRIQAGGGQADLLRLQLEIGRLEDRLAGLESRRPALSARLWALMGRRGGGVLPWPDPPGAAPSSPLPPPAELESRLLAANPKLRMQREKVARAEKERELAGLAGRPDLGVGVTWFETGPARMAGVADSGDDPLALSLTLSLPIWLGRYAARRRAAAAGVEGGRLALARLRNDLAARLAALRFKAEDRGRQAGLYAETLLPRAEQALAVTTRAYQAGKASVLDLVDREQVLLSFRLAELRARTDQEQALADLAALCGGELR